MAMSGKQNKETKEMTKAQKQELAGAEATRPGRVFTPSVDILETRDAIVVLADMPGVQPEGLTIDLRDNVLTIDGAVDEIEVENEQMLLHEYDTGAFHRQFRLTSAIDQGGIDAALRDGVLRLTLPKAAEAKPRKIAVKAG
jgi:HSP20 family molecular chaperone IbpA